MNEMWRDAVDLTAGVLDAYFPPDPLGDLGGALWLLQRVHVRGTEVDGPVFLALFIALCERNAGTKVRPSRIDTPGSLCVEGVVTMLCGPLPDGTYGVDWYSAGDRAAAWLDRWLDSLLDGGAR